MYSNTSMHISNLRIIYEEVWRSMEKPTVWKTMVHIYNHICITLWMPLLQATTLSALLMPKWLWPCIEIEWRSHPFVLYMWLGRGHYKVVKICQNEIMTQSRDHGASCRRVHIGFCSKQKKDLKGKVIGRQKKHKCPKNHNMSQINANKWQF